MSGSSCKEVGEVLLGTHSPRLDDKGRLILPAKFREELAAGVVVTRGQEHSLFVFPRDEFARLTGQMREAPLTNKPAREFLRLFASGASDEVPDRQGRINVPTHLRTYAGLTKDCVVIGMLTRLEIWDAATWERYLADKQDGFADLSEEVVPGLF